MSRYAILTGLMVLGVTAQAGPAAAGFKYVGCIEADPTSFGVGINFFAPFSADQCQKACGSKAMYAALGAGCHCDEPLSRVPVAFDIVDEAKCSTLCIEGDDSAGHCGGPSSNSGRQFYNLYQRDPNAIDTEECTKRKTTTAQVIIDTKVAPGPAPTIVTVTSCPPDAVDCPLSTAQPTAVDTKLPAASTDSGAPACPENCSGSECTYETSAAPSCSSGECPKMTKGPITPHVEPTEGPATTSAMSSVMVGQGSHQRSVDLAILSMVTLALAFSLV
ncbi:hypothetical protein PT974_06492 [Cladobotryum mycophilum]|uniref:WSC domain-containing protein n=1 Tax=Cladobotryum mycophilum TaxID=491253 RepID=A0ABR0SM04_9HYPO